LETRLEVVSLCRKRFFADRLAGLEERDRPGRPGTFSPDLVLQVKALAWDLPAKYGLPLSRWSTSDLVQHVQRSRRVAREDRLSALISKNMLERDFKIR
jgi:hypothetical protein